LASLSFCPLSVISSILFSGSEITSSSTDAGKEEIFASSISSPSSSFLFLENLRGIFKTNKNPEIQIAIYIIKVGQSPK